MINVLEDLELFFEHNNLKWEDVISASINQYDFNTDENDDIDYDVVNPDDLQAFKNRLKSLNYRQRARCDVQGCIWLSENRVIVRNILFWSHAEWELKQRFS